MRNLRPLRRAGLALMTLALLGACSSDEGASAPTTTTTTGGVATATAAAAAETAAVAFSTSENASNCWRGVLA